MRRRDEGRPFPIPARLMACLCIFAFFWGTTWLAGMTGFLPEYSPVSGILALACGIAPAIFPTGRRLGGCGLGCGLVFLAVFAIGLAASRFPGQDQKRPEVRLNAPVPQWLNGITPSVDGVTLGMPCPPGALVECAGGTVTAVEGRELRQGDRVLVKAGDPLERAEHVLQPGVARRSVFRRDGYVIVLQAEGSRVKSVSLRKAAAEGP